MNVELTACPEDECGVPAEVIDVFYLDSTGGPVRHEATLCANRHRRITITY